MHKPKRVFSCLVQVSTTDPPRLSGRIVVLGEAEVVTFASARELVEELRRLIRPSAEQGYEGCE